MIKGQSRYIRDYADRLGWSSDRYYGIDQETIISIRNHYRLSNDLLANYAWGCNWNEKFPCQERKVNVFDVSSIREKRLRVKIKSYVGQVVEDIREDRPGIFSR